MGPYYKPAGPKQPFWKRCVRVLLWALVVAAVAAFVAWLSIATGGAALPAGMTLLHYLLVQAGIGLAEGLLYGLMSEIMGARQAEQAINAMSVARTTRTKVERVSEEQMEAEIRQDKKMRETLLGEG